MTSRTTAHVVNAIDDRYLDIEKFLGEECARMTAQSHTAAINCAERIAGEHHIDCDFERVNGYLFLPPGGSVKELLEEMEAIHRAGLHDVARVDTASRISAAPTYVSAADCFYGPAGAGRA